MKINDIINKKLQFDIPILIAHAIAVIVIVAFLIYFVYRPFTKWLKSRQTTVDQYYKNAEKASKTANKIKSQAETELKKTYLKSEKILFDAQAKSIQKSQKIIEEARQKSRDNIAKSRLEADEIKNNLQKEINAEIIENAINLSRKLLKRELKTEDHQQLVEDFIKDVNKKSTK